MAGPDRFDEEHDMHESERRSATTLIVVIVIVLLLAIAVGWLVWASMFAPRQEIIEVRPPATAPSPAPSPTPAPGGGGETSPTSPTP